MGKLKTATVGGLVGAMIAMSSMAGCDRSNGSNGDPTAGSATAASTAAKPPVEITIKSLATGPTHTRKPPMGAGSQRYKAGDGKTFVVLETELVHNSCDPPQPGKKPSARVSTGSASLDLGGSTYAAVGGSAFANNVCINCDITFVAGCDGKKKTRAWFAFRVDADASIDGGHFGYRGVRLPLAGVPKNGGS
jgi:hypothetical protein